MKVLAIDPGYAHIGLAVFTLPESGRIHQAHGPLAHLTDGWEEETDSADPPTLRHRMIFVSIFAALQELRPGMVCIETPSTAGDYGGQKSRRANTNLLYQALGTIQAAVGLYGIQEHHNLEEWVRYAKAPNTRKTKRQKALQAEAGAIGIHLPTGKRGGKLANCWDAIVCGINCLNQKG